MRKQRHAAFSGTTLGSLLVTLLVPLVLLLSPKSTLRVVDASRTSTDESLRSHEQRPTRPPSPEELAAPWVALSDVLFPYEGLHNDLKRLLEVQASQGRISVTFFTAAQTPLLLNCVYSLVKYGQVSGYIVATVDQESLTECQRLRLPCFNASDAIDRAFAGTAFEGQAGDGREEAEFKSPEYRRLMFAKPVIVNEVFQLKPKLLHYTDVDVAYIRAVWPSYEGLMERGKADAAFMNEDESLNGGNFVLRYTKGTDAMVRRWAFAGDNERNEHLGDQELLWWLRGGTFDACDNTESCKRVRKTGKVALLLHQPQFGFVGWTAHCPGYVDWPACAPFNVYIHIICHSGLDDKKKWLRYYRLWHLQDDDFTPVTERHEYLPCADPVAWRTCGLRGEMTPELDPRDEKYVFLAKLKEEKEEEKEKKRKHEEE